MSDYWAGKVERNLQIAYDIASLGDFRMVFAHAEHAQRLAREHDIPFGETEEIRVRAAYERGAREAIFVARTLSAQSATAAARQYLQQARTFAHHIGMDVKDKIAGIEAVIHEYTQRL